MVPEVAVPGLQLSSVALESFWLQYSGNMYVVAQIDYMDEAAKVLSCIEKLLGRLHHSHALRIQPCLETVPGLQGINYTPTFRLYHKGRRVRHLPACTLAAICCCRALLDAWRLTRLCAPVCRLMSSCHRMGSRFATTSGCTLR